MDRLEMRKVITAVLWLFLSIALVSAHAAEAAKQSLRGYILDKKCADSVRDDHDPTAFIQHHTKDCALMRNCKASGYRLYSKGKWFDLDKKGNELAVKMLQQSKRKSDFYVEVVADLNGKVLQVERMKELDAEKTEQP